MSTMKIRLCSSFDEGQKLFLKNGIKGGIMLWLYCHWANHSHLYFYFYFYCFKKEFFVVHSASCWYWYWYFMNGLNCYGITQTFYSQYPLKQIYTSMYRTGSKRTKNPKFLEPQSLFKWELKKHQKLKEQSSTRKVCSRAHQTINMPLMIYLNIYAFGF